jgi:hypothetical protein
VVLPAHALEAVHVWSNSVSNEGHITLGTETVSRPCLASHFSRVTQTSHLALRADVVDTVQVWPYLVRNGAHFIAEAEIGVFFSDISPPIAVL